MTTVVLALGSNLGDRMANLRSAMALIEERGVKTVRASSIWETVPVPADQPRFLNAVIVCETERTPEALLSVAKEVESLLGRRPNRHWGPRPADIDILFFGDAAMSTTELTIPHPLIAMRAFVLVPLSEVVTGLLPGLGDTALQLLVRLGPDASEGMVRTECSLASPIKDDGQGASSAGRGA